MKAATFNQDLIAVAERIHTAKVAFMRGDKRAAVEALTQVIGRARATRRDLQGECERTAAADVQTVLALLGRAAEKLKGATEEAEKGEAQ